MNSDHEPTTDRGRPRAQSSGGAAPVTGRVAIVTLTGNTNYGNRLQNYALQQTLYFLGAETVATLEGVPRDEPRNLKALRLVSTAWRRRGDLLRRLTPKRGQNRLPDTHYVSPAVTKALSEFTQQHLRTVEFSPRSGPAEEFDLFVAGSDQIWNPAFTHGNPEWFLSFAPKSSRAAYAASFGIPSIPPYLAKVYARGLRGIPVLTVREERAAQIVENLTGSRPPVVLDPTMLLTAQDWSHLATSSQTWKDEGPYVAEVLLSRGDAGGASTLRARESEVARVATAFGAATKSAHKLMDAGGFGPNEFLGFIQDSAAVVTDSFHTAVFATLFHKPYFILPRGEMNSRFHTLQQTTGVGDRHLQSLQDSALARDVDWKGVDARVQRQREFSLDLLQRGLSRAI